jgi:serine/threonine protein kinase
MSTEEEPQKIRLLNTDTELPKHVVTGYYHYSKFEDLTEGGAASLKTCFDKNLCRYVAMKKLHPHLKDNEMEQKRFLREARVTSQIQHPSTVPVYELGRDDAGQLYFTMKKVEGQDLRKILSLLKDQVFVTLRDFPEERLLNIFVQVAQAVAYAHSQGVIHRDLKPANILIGSFGETIVLDWGLAKVFGEDDDFHDEHTGPEAGLELTRAGRRYGTPLYMSPEQARGETDVDVRCDIYNLGLILYEILTLENVVAGESVDEVLKKVLEEQPVPPHQRQTYRPVAPELEAICLKALQKNPDDRYASVTEMVGDVDSFMRNLPVSVFEDSPVRKLLKWRHRNVIGMASIISFVVGVLVTLAAVWLASQ